jgi:hypothetical protein
VTGIQPDEEWVDIFGDRLDLRKAGDEIVLTIIRRGEGFYNDHASVSLSPLQQRQLAARLSDTQQKKE